MSLYIYGYGGRCFVKMKLLEFALHFAEWYVGLGQQALVCGPEVLLWNSPVHSHASGLSHAVCPGTACGPLCPMLRSWWQTQSELCVCLYFCFLLILFVFVFVLVIHLFCCVYFEVWFDFFCFLFLNLTVLFVFVGWLLLIFVLRQKDIEYEVGWIRRWEGSGRSWAWKNIIKIYRMEK